MHHLYLLGRRRTRIIWFSAVFRRNNAIDTHDFDVIAAKLDAAEGVMHVFVEFPHEVEQALLQVS